MAEPYDLLLKGGDVIDPSQHVRQPHDIAFLDGRVAALAPDLPTPLANDGKVDTLLKLQVGDDVNTDTEKMKSITLKMLLSDPAADAGLLRVLSPVVDRGGVAWRGLGRLDQRPLGSRSLLHPADLDGRDQCRDAEDDAFRSRPDAAADDAASADHVHVLRLRFPQRPGALLGNQQPAVDGAAGRYDETEEAA